jgi:hypothetical protein
MSLALDSLACDLYGSKRCLIAWHVVLGMTVKVFICEIIVKETTHGALVGRPLSKTLHGGEVRGSILTDSIKFNLINLTSTSLAGFDNWIRVRASLTSFQ